MCRHHDDVNLLIYELAVHQSPCNQSTVEMAEKRRSPRRTKKRIDDVKRNENGGILVERQDLQKLFEFLSDSNKKYVTESDLRNRLSILYKSGGGGPSSKEYKSLMNNRSTLSIDDLYSILNDNELHHFDPVQESFKTVFDPNDTGFVDVGILRNILNEFGFHKITEKDLQVLVDAVDRDKDGKINLDDFRNIIKSTDSLHQTLNQQMK